MLTRHHVIVTIALVWLIVLGVWWNWPDSFLHIIMCDVGQGDGILITYGFTQWVVDTGPDERFVSCFAEHVPFFDRKIEAVLLTHADADHIGGFRELALRYQILQLYMNDTDKQTQVFNSVKQIIVEQGIAHQPLFQGDIITLASSPDRVWFEALWPLPQSTETEQTRKYSRVTPEKNIQTLENTRSSSGILRHGTLDVLLTGDIDCDVEAALMTRDLLVDIDILKVAHHGSKYSTCDQLLENASPEIAVLSVGKKNRYGHPDASVIKRLQQAHTRVLRTDLSGTIEIISDGDQYWVREDELSSMKKQLLRSVK